MNDENSKIISEAKETAEIVEKSVKNGELSLLPEKLEQLTQTTDEKEYNIFKYSNIKFYYIMAIICSILGMVFLYLTALSIGTIAFSNHYIIQAIIALVVSATIIAVNAGVISKCVSEIKFKKRYDKYFDMLKFRNVIIVENLAEFAKCSQKATVNDLNGAVKRKLIPQGHFGRNNILFLATDALFEEYQKKPAVYDRYYKKQLEERERMEGRTQKTNEILEEGNFYIKEIHDSNDIIKDKTISKKLDKMEKTVSMIFYEVDINPKQADKLGLFLNYYLPTTEKLLSSYINIDEKRSNTDTLKKMKKDIENALDKINISFENILDKFYREQEMDISSDISAMEIMMKQEGLIE